MCVLGLEKRENILNYESVKNEDTLLYLFIPFLCLHSLKGSYSFSLRVQVQFASNAKISILIFSSHQKWSIYIDKYPFQNWIFILSTK